MAREHLLGTSADRVDHFGRHGADWHDADVGFSLEKEAAQRLQLNAGNIERRADRLERAGAFDARRPDANGAFHRGHQAIWDEGHLVDHVEGNAVVDDEGRQHQARLVRVDQSGGAQARRDAERYRELATNWLRNRPGQRATAGELGTFLRQHDLGRKPPAHHLARLLGFHLQKAGPVLHIRLPAK